MSAILDSEKIKNVLLHTGERKIAVFGDYCLDKYIYTDPSDDDISVETGLTAWQIYAKCLSPGAAGTVTNNLCALGAKVSCIGAIGDDGEGYDLVKALNERGADTSYLFKAPGICTATYIKPMRKTPDGGWREDKRLDYRNRSFGSEELWTRLAENFALALSECDAAIISDQFNERNSGAVSDGVRRMLNDYASKHPEKPILVDSRSFAHEYKHMYVKCNNYELMKYLGEGDPDNYNDILTYGARLRENTGFPVFITWNAQGIVVFDNDVTRVPAYPVKPPIDVTGAGDASNAGITLGLSLGLSCAEAAAVATAVSSVTIEMLGTTGSSTPGEASVRIDKICELAASLAK